MNAAVLARRGGRRQTELRPRSVAWLAVGSLHALIIYLLISAAPGRHSGLDASVIEADVIPADQRISKPPSFPPVVLQASPVELPSLQVAIDVPPEQDPVVQVVDTRDPGDRWSPAPVASATTTMVSTTPVIEPQPITGPRGADRYPNESIKARESGTVVINICVSPAGKVDSVELAHSSGFPRLDRVALGMAAEYLFHPATLRGHPVAACAAYRIVFKVI